MSVVEKTYGIIKAVFLYQDTMKSIREDMAALSTDVVALSRAHGALAQRVARLEGFVEGAAAMSGAPRLQKD